MTTMTADIVSYTRVSTKQQEDKNTIKVQRAGIAEYVTRKGYNVAAEFSDDGVSGAIPFADYRVICMKD